MSRKIRFIKPLTSNEITALQAGVKSDNGYQFQHRCHAILLSNQGYTPSEIKDLFNVTVHTVYTWYNRWETGGIQGLKNASGQGRKPALCTDNKEHVKAVEKAVKKVNKRGGNLLAEIEAELELEEGLTMRIVRSFLKKLVTSGNDVEEL